jgi:hypothetical protein
MYTVHAFLIDTFTVAKALNVESIYSRAFVKRKLLPTLKIENVKYSRPEILKASTCEVLTVDT